MVLFVTTISQAGLVVGLYKFIHTNQKQILNIYYTSIFVICTILLLLGVFDDNWVVVILKLTDLSEVENLMFFLSIMVSSIFLFNKGKNVADKAYKYMLRISVTSFGIRIIVLCVLYFLQITSLSITLFLLFILPFVQDIRDFFIYSIRYVRLGKIEKERLYSFLLYCFRVWSVGALFMISDRIFLIYTKGTDVHFTTAIAFSAGFLGIISLFNSSFTNYFLSNLSSDRIDEIKFHVNRLKKMLIPYFGILLLICLSFSLIVYYMYPALKSTTAVVLFITLLRSGIISYLGMFSLLSKVLDFLNIEIILNILRIVVVFFLCMFWQPENLIIWYAVVMFTLPFPELVLTILIDNKLKRYANN
ncbi:hypothetical protein [uncultured Bacteroides sp.]|uniref:hypothetical protein n=1 Tax=uncultured Bacteroides sp. TaxID=162156 RepID=UPI002675B261|nr:hypothetical protein [uncultured Bacteroides sp.]